MSRSLEEERQKTVNILKEDIFTTVGATTGKYLDSNGNQVSNNAWNFTDYIRIEANQQYSISNNGVVVGNLPAICFYTKDKAFISGEQLGDVYNKIVKAPSNAEYARLSYASANYKFIKIDSNEIYSTEEQKIGTWIDGKPLYRKIYETTLTQSAQNIHTDITLNNLKKIEGYLNNGTQIIPLGFGNDGNYANVVGQEKRLLYLGTWSGGTLYITVEYTKTTD